ncbi:hypothetical protein NL676_017682 [Syzygium grande]|nr:hypothetical protein NL676_017682 [Syzygium grande]
MRPCLDKVGEGHNALAGGRRGPGIVRKFLNRDMVANGNLKESEDVGGGLEKSYLFCLTACPSWKRLSRR